MKITRIVLVEDNPNDAATLINDFARSGEVVVVHHFMTGIDFLNHISDNVIDFDVLIIDYRLPLLNGLETCRNIISKNVSFKHLLVSHGFYNHVMKDLVGMGSQNYCQKNVEIIRQLLPRIIAGKVTYEDNSQIQNWDVCSRKAALQKKDDSYWAENISPLEKKIIRYVCMGENSQVIAEALGYETSSIEKYRGTILKALDLKNSQQLTAWAFSYGLINASFVFCTNPIFNQVADSQSPGYFRNCRRSRKVK
jgi:DNA-binding NarL/FixJ family response regulator